VLSKRLFTDFFPTYLKKWEDIWNKKQRRYAGDTEITSEERE
jgi:hypothetical protein